MNKVIDLFKLEQEIEKAKKDGNFMLALKKYNEVIKLKNLISNKLGIAKTYIEKGYLLKTYGEKQAALDCFLQAANLAQNSKNQKFLEIINHQIENINI